MKYGVRLKINVSNIKKEDLFRGKKGAYLDATLFLDVDNQGQYGDNGMITQDTPKDSQDNNGAILGNATVFWKDEQPHQQQQQSGGYQQQAATQQQQPATMPVDDGFDDIPF